MSKSRKPSDLLPCWSKYETTDAKGRDPLGLSRVSHLITDRLLTGIITTTDRARYYSFYVWCLWHISENEKSTRGAAFAEAFQRRESAMVIATLMNDPSASVVGKQGDASNLAGSADKNATIDTQFRILPSSRMGGYGQYYRGCIYELGLRETTEDGIDQLFGEASVEIAKAFHAIVSETPYLKKSLYAQVQVPVADLRRSAEKFGLQSLESNAADQERELLTDLFWNDGPYALGKSHERSWNRRTSLALMFSVMEAYRKEKIPIETEFLDYQLLVAPCYYGQLVHIEEDGEKTIRFRVDGHLQECADLWGQFALHNFVAIAFEYVLKALVLVIGPTEGLELPEARDRLIEGGFIERLGEIMGAKASKPAEIFGSIGPSPVALRDLLHPQSEENVISQVEDDDATSCFAGGIALMSTIGRRWKTSANTGGAKTVGDTCAANNLWLGSLIELTSSWDSPTLAWPAAIDAILRCVVENHDRVMYEKHSLDACWIQRVGKRYRAEQEVYPQRRASRWWQTLSICNDLHLVSIQEGVVKTTELGRRRVARVNGSMS